MEKVSLLKIFLVFAKIGTITIGGGYMMVPAIENEIRRHKWISDSELPNIVAISQSAPGLLTVNMSIFAGYRLRGIAGSIAATLGCIIPPFVIILLIAMFFSNFKENHLIQSVFAGVRPASVAIIAAFMVKLIKAEKKHWWAFVICAVTLVLVAFLRVSAIYILLTLIIGALAFSYFNGKKV